MVQAVRELDRYSGNDITTIFLEVIHGKVY